MLRRVVPLLSLVIGCAGTSPPQPVAPGAAPAPAPAPAASAQPEKKAVVPAAVPPPPESCAAYTAHALSGCAPATPLGDSLAKALAQSVAERRDAALACLEAAPELPPGTVRALRAELAPVVCGDALVAPLLEAPPQGLPREIESAMLGLVVSARLARLLSEPPAPTPPVTRDGFRSFFAETLTPWVLSQAAAIERLSLDGSRLTGYGRGIAAIAAGNADLRFVEMVREVPLPDEMKADKDVRDAYYGALDAALEPRKVRGRDAALVGLRAFAEIGAFHDPRVTRARELLAKLWSGSRVDALDRLLVPDAPALDTSAPQLVVAALLPTFYAGYLLRELDPNEPKLLRAFMQQGLPPPMRDKLDKSELSEPVRLLYGRIKLESGRRFFRAADFQRARAILTGAKSEEGRLIAALSQSLENGPADAAELMLKGPFVKGTGDVSALDAEVARKGRYAGFAAFDAAYVLQLAPKPDDAAYWDELATRFAAAAKLLKPSATTSKDVALPSVQAREYAEAARATAAALRARK